MAAFDTFFGTQIKAYPLKKSHRAYKIAFLLLIVFLMFLPVGCAKKAKPKTGQIFVFSEPSINAEIKLDGKKTGKTSNTILKKIKPGRHRLELRKANPTRPDLPFVGEAKVDLKPGQKLRVTIQLNIMAIQPRKGNPKAIIAETEGQKTILDFYQAINNKDYPTAYGLLSGKHKQGYSYLSKAFIKYWRNINKVTVTGLSVKKVADTGSMTEIDTLGLDISYTQPVPPRKSGSPSPPPIAAQTDPKQPSKQQWNITTVGDPKDPGGIWRIEGIAKAEQ